MVDAGGGPIEVGTKLLALEHHSFHGVGQLLEGEARSISDETAAQRPQDPGPNVAVLVDAVAESHHHLPGGEPLLQPGDDPIEGTDLGQGFEHLFIGTPMERPLQRPDRRHDPRMHVRTGGDDRPCGERRGVELVFGIEDEGRAEDRGLRGARRAASESLEERRGDRSFRPGGYRPPGGEIEPGGEDRRHLSEEALRLQHEALVRPGLLVELDLPEDADACPEGIHRRRVWGPGGQHPQRCDDGRIE